MNPQDAVSKTVSIQIFQRKEKKISDHFHKMSYFFISSVRQTLFVDTTLEQVA